MITDRIRDLEIERVDTVSKRDMYREKMKEIEREYSRDIAQHAKEYGLTNQAARDSASDDMCAKDEAYQQFKRDYETLVLKIAYLDIDLSVERREFRRWEIEQTAKEV